MEVQLTGRNNSVEVRLGLLLANVPELIEALVASKARSYCVISAPDGRYVQFRALETELLVEVMANEFMKTAPRTTPVGEARLADLGFTAPTESISPNWHYVVTTAPQRFAAAGALSDVLLQIWGLSPASIVTLKSWAE